MRIFALALLLSLSSAWVVAQPTSPPEEIEGVEHKLIRHTPTIVETPDRTLLTTRWVIFEKSVDYYQENVADLTAASPPGVWEARLLLIYTDGHVEERPFTVRVKPADNRPPVAPENPTQPEAQFQELTDAIPVWSASVNTLDKVSESQIIAASFRVKSSNAPTYNNLTDLWNETEQTIRAELSVAEYGNWRIVLAQVQAQVFDYQSSGIGQDSFGDLWVAVADGFDAITPEGPKLVVVVYEAYDGVEPLSVQGARLELTAADPTLEFRVTDVDEDATEVQPAITASAGIGLPTLVEMVGGEVVEVNPLPTTTAAIVAEVQD